MASSTYTGVHIPNGCTVSIGDSTGSLTEVGVLDGDATIELQYDMVEYLGNQAEDVLTYVKNMRANASFNLVQFQTSIIAEVMGGIGSTSTVNGDPVSGAEQTIDSGWEAEQAILLEGQNGDGSKPTMNSVTGSTSGAGTVDDDYFLTKQNGKWYIVLRTDGTASFETTETITVDYDYTPAESNTITFGSSSVEMTPKVVRFELDNDGSKFRATLYAAKNENGITLAFPSAQNDNPATYPVSMVGRLDTSRSDKDQLIEIYDEIGV